MRNILFYSVLLLCSFANAQVLLKADGAGNTYSLITSVLAPGYNPIETPDCSHPAFGDHIDEVYDNEINTHVFRFHIHSAIDNDRCRNFDRQRNEIKTYSQSPENLKGIEGENVIYKWKFKLPTGFQSSSSFTHLHQLKSVGGELASMPIYTLTTRKGTPDQMELRYAETDKQVTLLKADLSPFLGSWLQVTEKIKYGSIGTYEIIISTIKDNTVLFSYSNNSIINWREDADFVRPKWGVYRSLNNVQDLRDEIVLFDDFSIEEVEILSSTKNQFKENTLVISPNPIKNTMRIQNVPNQINSMELFTLEGRKIMKILIQQAKELSLDVSHVINGTYIAKFNGDKNQASKLVVISNR